VTVRETFEAFFRVLFEEEDVDGWLALWDTDDPTILLRGSDLGDVAEGAAAIRAHGERVGKSLRFHWRELDVHERGDVAWVNAEGTVSQLPYRLTMVLLRNGDADWRVHTFTGSVPD
jgi:ketosteroid isomerase-like protein